MYITDSIWALKLIETFLSSFERDCRDSPKQIAKAAFSEAIYAPEESFYGFREAKAAAWRWLWLHWKTHFTLGFSLQ